MFHFNHRASDPTNPFIGQYVSLREHYIVQVPKGPSMLEEKLACPMEDAAHERRFLTSQKGSSMSTFFDQHVSIVARTIEMMENTFLNSGMIFYERTYSPSTNLVDTAGYVELRTDLLHVGDSVVGADKSYSDRIAESDFEDMLHVDSVDNISPAEGRLLLDQLRKRRTRLYQQTPTHLRVNKRIAKIAGARVSSKASQSVRDTSKSSAAL